MKMIMKQAAHSSEKWHEMVALRDKVLRKPLGLVFTPSQLANEHNQWHLGYYDAYGALLGVIVLVPLGVEVKMRQVAVHPDHQGLGLGREMIRQCEAFIREKGMKKVWCHAREAAVPFYLKQGYSVVGERFTEVGIEHFYMEKIL